MKSLDGMALATYLLALAVAFGIPALLYATVDNPVRTFPHPGPQEIDRLLQKGIDVIRCSLAERTKDPASGSVRGVRDPQAV